VLVLPYIYIYSIVSHGLQSFFHHFMRLIFKGGLQSGRLTFFYFISLKGLDDPQRFHGYILLTELFLYSLQHHSIIGGIMMNRGQL